MQSVRPALAVRALECLMCHAQINSNVITDFGYGDAGNPFFFANNSSVAENYSNYQYANVPWYGNYYGTWQQAAISGSVYVPKVDMTAFPGFISSISYPAGQALSLTGFMQLSLPNSIYGGGYAGSGPMTTGVTSPTPLVEESAIYIGAPAKSAISTYFPQGSAPGTYSAVSPSTVSGLVSKAGNGGNFVTNSASGVSCSGDVVVNGPLLLSSATITTGNAGCRLYATGTVFLVGAIKIKNSSGVSSSENLQLSSASGIMVGFDNAGLQNRLSSWYGSLEGASNSQVLFREASNATMVAQWENDAALVGDSNLPTTYYSDDGIGGTACANTPGLTSAQIQKVNSAVSECQTLGGTWTQFQATNGGPPAQTYCNCGFNYSRLLLNAPNVQSNYLGEFSGVIISELALFEPGATTFQYDSTFDSANLTVLPLLNSSPIFSVTPETP